MAILAFQKPDKVIMLENDDKFGKFEFRPLESGFGVTIGNALRRILLSSLEGFAINTIKIAGVEHEFASIPGVREDVTNIILNLKQVRFKHIVEELENEKVSLTISNATEFRAGDIGKHLSGFEVLNPDLVIAPDYTTVDVIEGLRHMGIPTVVVAGGSTVEGVIKNITDIANIVGEPEKGQFYDTKIRREMDELKRLGASISPEQRKSVLFVSSMDGYTGTGSLFDDMCRYMSINNAPSVFGLPPRTPFGEERVLAMNPDFIFIPSYKGMDKGLSDRYLENPAFENLPAIKEHRVKPLPAAYLYTMNQHIGEAMLAIMHTVYPQLERNSHD